VNPLSTWWQRRRALRVGRSLESLLTEGFVAIDLETTGLDPRRDAIVEVAAVPFLEGRSGPVYATHVDPGRPIPPESVRVHGITDSMVAGSPMIGDVLPRLDAVCGRHVLVGYGVGFDIAVLERERLAHGYSPMTNAVLDTKRLASALRPEWATFDLEGLATLLGIGILGRHTSEGDARAAGEILLTLIPELLLRGIRRVDEALWFQKSLRGLGAGPVR
jgi:DNA polymerase III epsilon subunit-like protein